MHSIITIVGRVADIFGDGETADSVGKHFTCVEADSIASLLVAFERTEDAVTWLLGHAEGDDDDVDIHGNLKLQYDEKGVTNLDEARQRMREFIENEL